MNMLLMWLSQYAIGPFSGSQNPATLQELGVPLKEMEGGSDVISIGWMNVEQTMQFREEQKEKSIELAGSIREEVSQTYQSLRAVDHLKRALAQRPPVGTRKPKRCLCSAGHSIFQST